MDKIEFIAPSNKRECKYIGLDFSKKNAAFFFPCQYVKEEETEEIKREEAKNILYLLKRIEQEYFYGGQATELLQFQSMLWLVQDFIERGYYVETEKISSTRFGGKINWKKTIQTNDIYFNDGNIIYKQFVKDRVVHNDAQTITEIYKCCLAYSIARIGFIFGINTSEQSRFSMEASDKNFMRFYLSRLLQQTFLDYKKTLIGHLLTIIDNQATQNQDSGYSIYDSEFEYVFEFLVNQVFGTADIKKLYNEYEYEIDGVIYPASTLRPDTIMTIGDTDYIIDSKYYNYGYTQDYNDLPQASSISKQIGYNQYRREQIDNQQKVRSIFLLPYATKNELCFSYVGTARRKESQNEEDEIGVYLVDLRELIHAYLYGSKKVNKEKLEEIIKNK